MWNNSSRCAVALTFDFDAETLWTSLGLVTPTHLSRGRYGAEVGVPRLLSLLEKHGIQGTFFVPGKVAETHTDVVKEIHARGHEVGHHGYEHEVPLGLTLEQERDVLQRGIAGLEKATGERPRGYRSPAWDLSANSIALFEEMGFAYDSSMMGDDFRPYRLEQDGKKSDIIELPVSWELDDAPHFNFSWVIPNANISAPSKVYEIWSSEFDGAYAEEGAFILTMHPQISGRYHRVMLLEKLIEYMAGHPDVWFTTCGALAAAWSGQEG